MIKNKTFFKGKKLKFIIFIVFIFFIGITYFFFFFASYYNDYGIAHITKGDVNSYQNSISKNSSLRAPKYDNTSLMKDVPSSIVYNAKTKKMESVPVWDTWPVQNPDGTLANFHGYHIVIGLTSVGTRDDVHGTRLGMYVQKISSSENDISSWQYLGNVFNSFNEGSSPEDTDKYIRKMQSEWAGSTILMHPTDNTLRLFYTNVMVKSDDDQSQALTTAELTLEPTNGKNWNSGIQINHEKTRDKKTIFVGDGKIYQRASQASSKMGGIHDSYAMRDPHFVEDDGKYYLIFEGNAGYKIGGEGLNNFNNRAYFGSKNIIDFYKSRAVLLKDKNNSEYINTYYSNAVLGKIELNADFTLKKVMKPVLSANGTHDVVERPNLFEYKGKWYLFADLAAGRFTEHDSRFNNQSYMIGYVSENGIDGTYKPLNGNGLVLSSSAPMGRRDYTYSFFAIKPKDDSDVFVVTSFANNRTFAPSYLMTIKKNKTKIFNDRLLDQGALVDTKKYYLTTPQSKLNG